MCGCGAGEIVSGALKDAAALLRGEAGTIITMDAAGIDLAETVGLHPSK